MTGLSKEVTEHVSHFTVLDNNVNGPAIYCPAAHHTSQIPHCRDLWHILKEPPWWPPCISVHLYVQCDLEWNYSRFWASNAGREMYF